jgi:hypothetical protein
MPPTTPGSKKIRLTYGPLELKPANVKRPAAPGKMDPNSDQFMGIVTGVPTGVLVVRTNSSLTYEDGSVADVVNGVYNHHLIFADSKRNGPTPFKCVDGGATIPDMGLLMGASEANRDLQFYSGGKIKTGFKLDKNDPIILNAELVNYTNDTKKVYTITDFEYMEVQPADAMHVTMQVFDITTCNANIKDAEAPAGKTKWALTSKKAQFTKPGYILYRRGHMHDGGESVEILVNGKQVCDSKASYGGAGSTTKVDGKEWATISKMASCADPVTVETGDSLQIIAHFDLDAHPA